MRGQIGTLVCLLDTYIPLPCSSNESTRRLNIPRTYITSSVNSTEEMNCLLSYSSANTSLHNIPVNRKFINMSF